MSACAAAWADGEGVGGTLTWLLVLAALVLALLALRARGAGTLAQRQWRAVFDQLASANGLVAEEARALWRLGVGAGLDNPALVFVRPTLFESRAAMAQLDPELVQSIRSKVFGA